MKQKAIKCATGGFMDFQLRARFREVTYSTLNIQIQCDSIGIERIRMNNTKLSQQKWL